MDGSSEEGSVIPELSPEAEPVEKLKDHVVESLAGLEVVKILNADHACFERSEEKNQCPHDNQMGPISTTTKPIFPSISLGSGVNEPDGQLGLENTVISIEPPRQNTSAGPAYTKNITEKLPSKSAIDNIKSKK